VWGGFGLLVVTGCATTTYSGRAPKGDTVGAAFAQPLRDLSVMREAAPDILTRAAAAPYALDAGAGCASIQHEMAALDSVLGPDLDAAGRPADKSVADAGELISGAIGSAVGLPYRGIVRKISGAEQRERVLGKAIFAGMVRRAFLRGAARAASCRAAPP
jgi:hypothetical protein